MNGMNFQIKSTGRGQPVSPQSIVAIAASLNKNERKQRSREKRATKEKDCYAPLGQEIDFSVMDGELVFTRTNPYTRSRGQIMNRSGLCVFSTINGLSEKIGISFVGVAATQSHLHDKRSDDMLTVLIAGTATVVNTGCCTINANSVVYFSERPSVVRSPHDPDLIAPGVLEKGQPPTKFRPSLVVFNTEYLPTIIRKIDKIIKSCSNNRRDIQAFKQGFIPFYSSHITPLKLLIIVKLIPLARSVLEDDSISKHTKARFEVWIKNAVADLKSEYGIHYEDEEKDMMKLTLKIISLYDKWKTDHRVGIALTTSSPGEPLDLLIQK